MNWGMMTKAERDAAYNNSDAVKNSAELNEARIAASEPFARPIRSISTCATGPKERNVWDLFPSKNANAPCLVFIHGGYWQRNSRDQFASLIAGVHAHGWAAALPGYTLAPDASLTEIVAEINAALDWLAANGAAHGINGKVVLSGWSAGGHLTAQCLGHARVSAGLAVSGVFELGPIRDTYLNDKMQFTDTELADPLAAPAADDQKAAGHHLRHGRAAAPGRRQPRAAREAGSRASAGGADPGRRRRPFHHHA